MKPSTRSAPDFEFCGPSHSNESVAATSIFKAAYSPSGTLVLFCCDRMVTFGSMGEKACTVTETYFSATPTMPVWVWGYFITSAYAVEFEKESGDLWPEDGDPQVAVENAMLAIPRLAGLGNLERQCCWVGLASKLVYPLQFMTTEDDERPRLDRSRLPPTRKIVYLKELLKKQTPPRWYRLDDGRWAPTPKPYTGKEISKCAGQPLSGCTTSGNITPQPTESRAIDIPADILYPGKSCPLSCVFFRVVLTIA